MFPDTRLVAIHQAELMRQAEQQRLVQLVLDEKKSWRQRISPVIDWFYRQRSPEPTVNLRCETVANCQKLTA